MTPRALPSPRHGHCVEQLPDGSLLCFGGFADASAADRGARQTWRLAPGDDTWQRCADLVHEQAFGGSGVVDGVVYAIGEAVQRYEPAADRWHVVAAPGVLPRSHLAACAHDGALWVLAGLPANDTGFFRVDLPSGVITALPAPPGWKHGDHLPFLFSLGDELHALGGMRNEPWGVVADHHVRRDGQWVALHPAPRPLWAKFGAGATIAHGKAQLCFDENGGLRLDAATGSFTPCAAPPAMVAMPAAVTIGDAIWWLGGMRVEGRAPVLWRYDVAADRWRDETPR